MGSIHNKPVLIHIMVWRRKGDKPLSETWPIVPTPICVTTPRCFRKCSTSHSSPTQHHTVYLSFAHVKCFKILITQRTTPYKRVNASRRAMYVLASMGCPYPGLATEVKVHLWKTIGLPSLLYNLEIFKLKPEQQKFIESVQSSIIQRIVGFPKRSHHTALLQAIKIDDAIPSATRNTLSLWWRPFQVDNPNRKLQIKLMNEFYNGNGLIPGTILQGVVSAGFSTIKSLFTKQSYVNPEVNSTRDGVVDSLRYLVCNENL